MNNLAPDGTTRRSLLRGFAGGTLLLAGGSAISGCGSSTSKDTGPVAYAETASGKVRYLCWEGFADESFVADFKGPSISSTYFGSFDEMFGKLRSGGGSSYDAVTTASDVIIPLAEAGLLAPIDVDSMPNYKNLREQLRSSELWNHNGDQYAIPLDWGSTVLLANDRSLGSLDATVPFDTLFDTGLRKRVTAMDDLSVIYTTATYLGYKEYWALTDDQLAEIQALLVDKLLPNIRKFSVTFADQANLFANQEVDLAWGWTGVIKGALAAVNVDYVSEHTITPAMPWYVDTISAVAKSPNPEGVGAWMNYNLDAKVSAQRFQVNGLPAIVPDAAQFLDPQQQELSYLTPASDSFWTGLDPDLQWHPVERRSLYQQVWNSVKSGIKEFSA